MTFFFLLVPAILIAFIVISLFVAKSLVAQREFIRTFLDVATQFNGRLTSATRLNTVSFNERDVSFVMQGKYIKGRPSVQVYAFWPDIHFRAKFFPDKLPAEMKKFIGMQDIEVGNPEFDRRFVVQANDTAQLLEFLDPDAQAAIFSMGNEVVLNISGGRIQLESQISSFSDSRQVDNIVRQFVNSYFVLSASFLKSNKSVEVTSVTFSTTDAVCMVCGELVLERRVICRTCATPHHQECWEYLGQCSTYACGQTKFRNVDPTKRFQIK